MVAGTIVAICQFGGEFVTKDDGSMSYIDGEAHAVNINRDMLYDDLLEEIASMFNIDSSTMCIKYFLPINKRTLITVSSDKDLERMIDFNADSLTIDIYVSNKAENRTTRSIAADSGTSIVDTAAADHSCRSRRPSDANNVSTRVTRSRAVVAYSSAHKAATCKRGRTSVADSNIPKTVTSKTAENVKQKRPKAAERTVIRVVVDDSAAQSTTIPPIHTDTQERLILSNIHESDEANPLMGISLDAADDIGLQHLANHWEAGISDVGQEFENVRAFRDELCKHAFAKGFAFKYVKNDKLRVTVKCTSENCPWRVHASRSSRKQTFIIKKINNVHTCGARAGEDSHRRARKLWLAGTIRKKVLENPDCKPKDIARDLYEEYGVHLSYSQAWHSKEVAQKEIHLLQEEACNQLPWLCEQIIVANPGSIATVATSVDVKFRRCFISFYASLHGFEHGCRPLIFLDRILLKVNNYWKLLVATSVDGENEFFPLAFATVEEETPESWHWFLVQLRYAISQKVTIVSSRQKGLDESVPRIFEDCYHCYSLFHLIEDFKAVLKKGSWSDQQKGALVDYLKGAAHAYLLDDFNAFLNKMNDISEDVVKWVISSKPENWSNAFFNGESYGHLSTDIINSLSDWITMKDESSAVQIMDALLVKMMDMMYSRQQTSSTWEDTLTPSMERMLQKEMSRARSLNVICSTETVFEVRCSTVNVVDIGRWECTCRRWQVIGLPCMHAVAVFDRIGRSVYDYCSKYLRRESYAATYSTPIRPTPDINLMKFVVPSSPYPPPRTRPMERPRRKRINPHKTTIRPLRCSRCKIVGHNKATCDVQL